MNDSTKILQKFYWRSIEMTETFMYEFYNKSDLEMTQTFYGDNTKIP